MTTKGYDDDFDFEAAGRYKNDLKILYEQQTQIGRWIIWRGIIPQKYDDIQDNTYRSHGFNVQTGEIMDPDDYGSISNIL